MGNSKSRPELATPLNATQAAFRGDLVALREIVGTGNRGQIFFHRDGLYPIHMAAITCQVHIIEELARMWQELPKTPPIIDAKRFSHRQESTPQWDVLDYLGLKDWRNGATPLHYAASHGHARAIATLIRAGKERKEQFFREFVNRQDNSLVTPLQYALIKPKLLYDTVVPSTNPYSPAEVLMAFSGIMASSSTNKEIIDAMQKQDEIRRSLSAQRRHEIQMWVFFPSLVAMLLKFC